MLTIYSATIIIQNKKKLIAIRQTTEICPTALSRRIQQEIDVIGNESLPELHQLHLGDTIDELCATASQVSSSVSITFPDKKTDTLLLSVNKSYLENPTELSFRKLTNDVPWHLFGKNEENVSLRQSLFGDLMDWIRDKTGHKDPLLGFTLMGEHASSLTWDGMPSPEHLENMALQTEIIWRKNGKNCSFIRPEGNSHIVSYQPDGTPSATLKHENNDSGQKSCITLTGHKLLNCLESIIEEENGNLPF